MFAALRDAGNTLVLQTLLHDASAGADVRTGALLHEREALAGAAAALAPQLPHLRASQAKEGACAADARSTPSTPSTAASTPSTAGTGAPGAHRPAAECVASAYTAPELPRSAQRVERLYATLPLGTPLLPWALDRLAAVLDAAATTPDGDAALALRDEWHTDGRGGTGDLVDVTGSPEWFRVWSALLFVYCMPPLPRADGDDGGSSGKDGGKDGDNAGGGDDAAQFGDGFLWAGTAIVWLLGQRERWEAGDGTRHCLAVAQFEEAGASTPGSKAGGSTAVGDVDDSVKQQAAAFSRAARRAAATIERAFATLAGSTPAAAAAPDSRFAAMEFLPPDDDLARAAVPSMGASQRNVMAAMMRSPSARGLAAALDDGGAGGAPASAEALAEAERRLQAAFHAP